MTVILRIVKNYIIYEWQDIIMINSSRRSTVFIEESAAVPRRARRLLTREH